MWAATSPGPVTLLGESPSTTFLFDPARTGRARYAAGDRPSPEVRWRFALRSHPPSAPESAVVFDAAGNLYFGAHDGCFYALDAAGRLRWMYRAGAKIHASPSLAGDRVVFASGDGWLHCAALDGTPLWHHDLDLPPGADRLGRAWARARRLVDPPRHVRGRNRRIRCWASPAVGRDGTLLAVGEAGLHALDPDGRVRWHRDLGRPRHHLAGVAQSPEGDIFVAAQRRRVLRLAPDGAVRWERALPDFGDRWGNPSYDAADGTLYLTEALGERAGLVTALDPAGRVRWCRRLGAVRGGVAIADDEFVVVADLDGHLHWLAKADGRPLHRVRLSRARRALWTTPVIDPRGDVFLTVKEGPNHGCLRRLDAAARPRWRFPTGKALSVPVIDRAGNIYFGSWSGELICLAT